MLDEIVICLPPHPGEDKQVDSPSNLVIEMHVDNCRGDAVHFIHQRFVSNAEVEEHSQEGVQEHLAFIDAASELFRRSRQP